MTILRRSQIKRMAEMIFGLGDAEDAREIFAKDGEGARGKRGAEAVGDGVGGVDGLQRAGGDGAVGVVGVGGFAAEDAGLGADRAGAQAGAAEQAAAADWREESRRDR